MSSGRALVVYTLLRILLLVAVGAVFYRLGARGFLLALLAFITSGAISLVVLDRPRSDASRGLGKVLGGVNDKIDAAAAKEDVDPQPEDADSEAQADSQADSGRKNG